jgi:hypothetical protein
MSECTVTRERMPLLLTEALEGNEREVAYLHIEGCEACGIEWRMTRETWTLLGVDGDRPVPGRVRDRFLSTFGQADAATRDGGQVVSFWRRPATRWLAQAAAVATLVGGAWFAGNRATDAPMVPMSRTAEVSRGSGEFTLAASRVVPASALAPHIEGSPAIANVRFIENAGRPGEVGVSFDLTSNVTVTGSPDEKSFVSLMAYLLQDRSNPTPSQSEAIQWVRQTYGGERRTDPAIVTALANVLRSDSHEGVRLGAIETLRTVLSKDPSGGGDAARDALIEVLKNDPNPAIRIKAVEVLTTMLSGEGGFESLTIETLRDKASQSDENPYVRIKAAEALSQLSL